MLLITSVELDVAAAVVYVSALGVRHVGENAGLQQYSYM
jgi:hypothetical protein